MGDPIKVGFNSENEVVDLPIVPELAASDERAVVVSGVEVHAEEGVGHVTSSPRSSNVAAEIKSSPRRRRCRDRRRGRIRSRPYANVSGIRGHWKYQQRRDSDGRMRELAHELSSNLCQIALSPYTPSTSKNLKSISEEKTLKSVAELQRQSVYRALIHCLRSVGATRSWN